MKREKVDHFFTQNEQKSSYAERAIKTMKSKLSRYMSCHQTHRWIDVLDSVTQLQRKLSSFHQDDPTRSNEERRSPIVETTARPSGDPEENETALHLQEGRHCADFARVTTFRSRVRRALDRGILHGGRSRSHRRPPVPHVKGHDGKSRAGNVLSTGIEQSIGNGSDGLPHRKSFTTKEKRGDGEMDGMALEIQKLDTHGSLKDYKRLEG
jgi:hypothetical protein